MPVAARLLTSAPTPASSTDVSHAARSRSLDGDGGALARHPVSFENVGDVVNVPGAGVERLGVDGGDGRPRDPAVEEGGHRHLVGPAQHRRGAPSGPAGLEGEAEAGEGVEVGGLERELRDLGPVDRAERLGQPGRRAEGEPDGQAHVGHRELGDGRAVDELDHAVDRPTAGARRPRCGRTACRTARGPRSPRGPCSSASTSRS